MLFDEWKRTARLIQSNEAGDYTGLCDQAENDIPIIVYGFVGSAPGPLGGYIERVETKHGAWQLTIGLDTMVHDDLLRQEAQLYLHLVDENIEDLVVAAPDLLEWLLDSNAKFYKMGEADKKEHEDNTVQIFYNNANNRNTEVQGINRFQALKQAYLIDSVVRYMLERGRDEELYYI